MEGAAAGYEPYHFHLLYDVVLSVAGFLICLATSRAVAGHHPQLRVRLFALVIGLPILGEFIAWAAYQVRPAPPSPAGQAILRFHEECRFCPLLDEPLILSEQPRLILSALLLLTLLSVVKNWLGILMLGRLAAAYPSFPIDAYPGLSRHLLGLSSRGGRTLPRVAVSPHSTPLALTFGLRRSTIIISEGMLGQFSRPELESVLAHELAHDIRRDNLWNWLMALFRDTFFFLPTTHLAWRQMVLSQEEACDDLTILWTGRPLDLARSLVKAWQHPRPRELVLLAGLFLVTPFFRRASAVERRVKRIVHRHHEIDSTPPPPRPRLAFAALGLVFLLSVLPIALGC
ncbi:MAG: M56 family metallopeptidase [Anaerolineae bacterium]